LPLSRFRVVQRNSAAKAQLSVYSEPPVKRGTLWQSVLDSTEHAVQCGALENIPTRVEHIEERGIRFQVHIVQQLERKRVEGITQRQEGTNPFLPYDKDMFVADISDTHVCLLNKFNVMEHHLLIVTREFEHQETLLTKRDFEAMWRCLREFEGLAFYNSGTISGASQPHKHLQQVPLPLGGCSECTPIDSLLAGVSLEEKFGVVPAFKFSHVLAHVNHIELTTAEEAGREIEQVYLEMLRHVDGAETPGPYNLLATRGWMLLVPRSVEHYGSISVNALGFAGSLLARDERELELIRARGPLGVLEDVGRWR
jgi:sulfate adenylyltransferase (ADP) / ATP adenylyltransferase